MPVVRQAAVKTNRPDAEALVLAAFQNSSANVDDIRGRRVGTSGEGVVRTAGRLVGVYLINTGSVTQHSVKKITDLR